MPELGAFRFLYLNAYSFLLLFSACACFGVPLYMIHPLFLLVQIPAGLCCMHFSIKLFATWKDKKRKYAVLMAKNQQEFREETFEIFMQAPCGRLLVRTVLYDLGVPQKYRDLVKFKKGFRESLKDNCTPVKTVVYTNEDFK